MRFSQDFIEKVRDTNNIVDEISQYTQLQPKGGRLFSLCPFPDHNEKTASFSVSESKQVYYCFGCKKSGNIYTFVQALKGFSFPETVEYLANKAGIQLPVVNSSQMSIDDKARQERNTFLKINEFSAKLFHKQLMSLASNHPIRVYCNQRGLTQEIIETFELGCAPEDWDFLTNALEAKKAQLGLVEKLGLIKKRPKGNGHYDIFRDRLIFPIVSHKGQYVGFGGRVMKSDQQPKYLNSPESPVFNKGKLFYGLNEAAKHIRVSDYAIVVEGYMDLIALYRAGLKNTVATLGTALTPEHAKLIKRYTKNIVVLFDGDKAGQAAAERSLPTLLSAGLLPKACVLPEGCDPDDFLRDHGADHLIGKVAESKDLFTLLVNEKIKTLNINDPISKVRLLDEVGPILSVMEDKRLKSLYLEQIAQKLTVDMAWVVKGLKGDPATRQSKSVSYRPQEDPGVSLVDSEKYNKINVLGATRAELLLMNLALVSVAAYEKVLQAASVGDLINLGVKEIFKLIDYQYRQMPNEFDRLSALLMDVIEPSSVLNWHLDTSMSEVGDEALEKMIIDCGHQIRSKSRRIKTRQLAANINNLSPQEQREKLEQIMNMYRDKVTIKKEPNL